MARKSNGFQPMLYPNEAPVVEDITGCYMMSLKLDGIRCVFKDGMILSRQLKPIRNIQLNEKFKHLAEYSLKHDVILDGEFYAHERSFQEITHYVMTEDLNGAKSKKSGFPTELPSNFMFYCFDAVPNQAYNMPAEDRYNYIPHDQPLLMKHYQRFVNVKNGKIIGDNQEISGELPVIMEASIMEGYEGLILKRCSSPYKCGRITPKSGDGYKLKLFRTFDAVILDVVQATKAKEGSERTVNERGYSVTSKKKDDRELIEKAAAFVVPYEDKTLKVTIALSDPEKEEIWANRESYKGKHIEYKGTMTGAKDVPRFPEFERFRPDLDGVTE